jgi:hypothetical protein
MEQSSGVASDTGILSICDGIRSKPEEDRRWFHPKFGEVWAGTGKALILLLLCLFWKLGNDCEGPANGSQTEIVLIEPHLIQCDEGRVSSAEELRSYLDPNQHIVQKFTLCNQNRLFSPAVCPSF